MNNRMTDTTEAFDTFPTPAELGATRRAKATAEVRAVLDKIRTHLETKGPGAVFLDWPSQPARAEVARILAEKGWDAQWGSDQREGSWITVTAR